VAGEVWADGPASAGVALDGVTAAQPNVRDENLAPRFMRGEWDFAAMRPQFW